MHVCVHVHTHAQWAFPVHLQSKDHLEVSSHLVPHRSQESNSGFQVGRQCLYLLCPLVGLWMMPSRSAPFSSLWGQSGKAAFLMLASQFPWVPMLLFLESLGLKGGCRTSRAWLDSRFPLSCGAGVSMPVLWHVETSWLNPEAGDSSTHWSEWFLPVGHCKASRCWHTAQQQGTRPACTHEARGWSHSTSETAQLPVDDVVSRRDGHLCSQHGKEAFAVSSLLSS